MGELAAEVTIEDLSPVKKKLSFEIPWKEVQRELDATYGTFSRKAKVKGFRPGKIPRNVLELYYRKDAEAEALSNLVSRRYADAITEHDIFAVAQPVIDQEELKKDEPFSFTATVEIRPEFEPEDYTGLEITKDEYDVTDEDVNSRLHQMREMYATLEEVTEERETKEGDFVVIDFEVTVDGKIRDELATENYTLQIGGGKFVADFEDKIKGLTKGQEKTVEITFPDDYQPEELAGKQGFFKVVVKAIREKNVPELNDDFVKNFEQYDSVDGLKEAVRKSLEDEANVKSESDVKQRLIDKLLERNKFEIPSVWIEQQIYYMMLDSQRRMISNGMTAEKAAEFSMNYCDQFRESAERIVRKSFILAKIAEKESITVEEKDIEERLKSIAGMYGRTYDELDEAYEKNQMKDRLKDELQEDKTIEYLIDKASITVQKKDRSEIAEERR
ncbi:MAG: trigger factor [Syntrophales bacterium]|nr:trigger factor [Syntrophales bacterium]MDY0044830.1 trigger factor [Syntrophales bacterium]